MSEEKKPKSKLPPKTSDKIVEVSLKQVIWGFTVLIAGTVVVGSTIILLKDYSKYKRQKAIIESITELIVTFQNQEKGEQNWKREKNESSYPTKISSEQQE